MPVPPTWEDRELPVLRAVIELYEEIQAPIPIAKVVQRTGFDVTDVVRSLKALAESGEGYFTVTEMFGGMIALVHAPSGNARRAAGNWPTPNILADRLIARFMEAADDADNDEKRSKLRSIASFIGGSGREIVVQIAAETLARKM